MQSTNGKLPLQNIKVIDFSQILAGPFCTMLLADMGADVVKIEKPNGGDDTRRYGPPFIEGESAAFLTLNRNKRSIVLDLKSEQGIAIVRRMLEDADVMIHNFRPGVVDRIGACIQRCERAQPGDSVLHGVGLRHDRPLQQPRRLRPRGAGHERPHEHQRLPGAPPAKVGVPMADLNTGMFCAYGILTAYINRLTTGQGQHVDASADRVGHRLYAVRVGDILRNRRGGGAPRLRAPHDCALSGIRHAGRLHQHRRGEPEQLGAHVPRGRTRRPARRTTASPPTLSAWSASTRSRPSWKRHSALRLPLTG